MHGLPQYVLDEIGPDAVIDQNIREFDMPSCNMRDMVLDGKKAKQENKTSIGSVYHRYQTQGDHLQEAIWRFNSLQRDWPGEEQEYAGHLVAANIAMFKATNGKIGIDVNDRVRHYDYFKAQEKQWEKNSPFKGTFSALPENVGFKNNQFYPLNPQYGGSKTQNHQSSPLKFQYRGPPKGSGTQNYQSYQPSQSFHSQDNHNSTKQFGECSKCKKKIYQKMSSCPCGGRVYYPMDFGL